MGYYSIWARQEQSAHNLQHERKRPQRIGEGQRRVLRILQLSRRDLCLAQPFPTADSHMVSVLIAFATASVGCQYLPGGLGREPHCHAGGRKQQARAQNDHNERDVGRFAARRHRQRATPTPKGRALVWVCVCRGRGFGLGVCLGAGPSTPVPWSGAGGSLAHSSHRWRGGWILLDLSPEAFEWEHPTTRLVGVLRVSGFGLGFCGVAVWAPDPLLSLGLVGSVGLLAWAWWSARAAAAPPADTA